MPIYNYRCNECKEETEVKQRITEDPLTTCDKCYGELKRVIGSPGIVFKGVGFYSTDKEK